MPDSSTLTTEPFVLNGTRGGELEIRRHKTADLEAGSVDVGVWALLADADFPEELANTRVGRVIAIDPLATEPGFSRVILEPAADVTRLREVQVFTKQPVGRPSS